MIYSGDVRSCTTRNDQYIEQSHRRKTTLQKAVAFLYRINKQVEKDMETVSPTIT